MGRRHSTQRSTKGGSPKRKNHFDLDCSSTTKLAYRAEKSWMRNPTRIRQQARCSGRKAGQSIRPRCGTRAPECSILYPNRSRSGPTCAANRAPRRAVGSSCHDDTRRGEHLASPYPFHKSGEGRLRHFSGSQSLSSASSSSSAAAAALPLLPRPPAEVQTRATGCIFWRPHWHAPNHQWDARV
jgi:hypothetical protein